MQCRFLVCIPVFNNPKTIVSVIEKCLVASPYPLLVVDDGSEKSVEDLCKEQNCDLSRITILRHSENHGKGVALQSAFKYALENNFTHLAALDGDGQHDPTDLKPLTGRAAQHPFSLIVGDREMRTENVPGSSTFGKAFSNFWVRYQTDVNVADSQSGYRVYPLFFVQDMSFFSKKYDFEIEILTRLIWKGVKIENVKVKVQYFSAAERVSHFHKFKDNARISVVNTFLVIGAMLRGQTSPVKSALAVALGVFVGCTPLFGLHTGIVVLISLFFRLNFVYLWVGTQISLPFFIPFLIWASTALGKMVLGTEGQQGALGFGYSWGVGSLILGAILGVISFFIVWIAKSRTKSPKIKTAWAGKSRNPLGIIFMRSVLQFLGRGVAYFFLYFIAFYYFLFSLKTRKAFAEYWKTIRPGIGFWERQKQMYLQVLMFARSLVDRAMQRESPKPCFNTTLDESVQDFLKTLENKEKGVVMVASHVGGWEMALTFFAQLPKAKNMLAVMYGIVGQFEHRSLEAQNKKAKVVYFNAQENTILKLKSHLEAGDIIGMMGDRPVTQSCELAPFFNKLALFDTTAIRLAIACQSDLFFIFAIKESTTDYKVYTFKPTIDENLSKDQKVQSVVKQYAGYLETIVNKGPTQWYNFFPFWSSAPEFW